MVLSELLKIRPGITAVIGGGGKTTLLRTLGEELARAGASVLLCTTTKIYPFQGVLFARTMEELDEMRKKSSFLCTGLPIPGTEKITAPEAAFSELVDRFDYILVEADGSAQLPLKAHEAHEPVVPPEANQIILVLGASGVDRPIREAAHRPELYAQRAGVTVEDSATPERIAKVINSESLHTRVLINQAETPEIQEKARKLGALLGGSVVIGSLQRGEYMLCSY